LLLALYIRILYSYILFYSEFLLDAAIGSADDIDTSDRDVGVDGLARLDGRTGGQALCAMGVSIL
jgi:hypothetical protein